MPRADCDPDTVEEPRRREVRGALFRDTGGGFELSEAALEHARAATIAPIHIRVEIAGPLRLGGARQPATLLSGYSPSCPTSPPSASSFSRVCPPSSRKRDMRRRAAAVGSERLKQSASSSSPSTVGSSAAFTARLASAIASAGKDAIR